MSPGPELSTGSNRDLHLLLPVEPSQVLLVDGDADDAAPLRAAGHTVTTVSSDDEVWPEAMDVGIVLSLHRAAVRPVDLLQRVDRAVQTDGVVLVVDRPRWAWPDLLGRRDPISGRRWRHGALSARVVGSLIERHRPIDGIVLATPHDRRLRHLAPLRWSSQRVGRAAVRRALRALWEEAELPLPAMASLLAMLPGRVLRGTAPCLVWVAGRHAAERSALGALQRRDPTVFLGSRTMPAVTIVDGPEGGCRVHSRSVDPSWDPTRLAAVADALTGEAVAEVRVATHVIEGGGVDIGWLPGAAPTQAQLPMLAAALGRIHRATGRDGGHVRDTTLAQGTVSMMTMLEDARRIASPQLASLLDGLLDEPVTVGWCHGDWGRRNARIHAGGVGVFDLDFADECGPIPLDIGWFLVRESAADDDVVRAYERAAGRLVTQVDLRLGLAAMLVRYGPDEAASAWRRASNLGVQDRVLLHG